MTEKPAEKSESQRVLNLKLNIKELENLKVPELDKKLFGVWEKESDVSKEYCELAHLSCMIARYLAACVNEGPEVKDNLSKRMILTKQILEEFLGHVAINGWMLYGLLFEYSNDVYMDISGNRKTIELLQKIQKRAVQKSVGKQKGYVT
jgi:hypothetical protein